MNLKLHATELLEPRSVAGSPISQSQERAVSLAGSISSHCRWTMTKKKTKTTRRLVPVQQVTLRAVAAERRDAERVGVTRGTGQVSHMTSITATSTPRWSVGVNQWTDSVLVLCACMACHARSVGSGVTRIFIHTTILDSSFFPGQIEDYSSGSIS